MYKINVKFVISVKTCIQELIQIYPTRKKFFSKLDQRSDALRGQAVKLTTMNDSQYQIKLTGLWKEKNSAEGYN